MKTGATGVLCFQVTAGPGGGPGAAGTCPPSPSLQANEPAARARSRPERRGRMSQTNAVSHKIGGFSHLVAAARRGGASARSERGRPHRAEAARAMTTLEIIDVAMLKRLTYTMEL